MLRVGAHRALVIGADTLSRITDFEDRATAVLFGDGAGAVVVESGADGELILAYDLGVDGSAADLLYAELGGYIQMDGREVYRRAVRVVVDSITKVLETAGVKRRRHSRCSSPTRRTCASSRRSTTGSVSRWSRPRSSSTAPATPRRPRSRSRSARRPTRAASTRATSSCSPASVPG